jgi:hypothetical protein
VRDEFLEHQPAAFEVEDPEARLRGWQRVIDDGEVTEAVEHALLARAFGSAGREGKHLGVGPGSLCGQFVGQDGGRRVGARCGQSGRQQYQKGGQALGQATSHASVGLQAEGTAAQGRRES